MISVQKAEVFPVLLPHFLFSGVQIRIRLAVRLVWRLFERMKDKKWQRQWVQHIMLLLEQRTTAKQAMLELRQELAVVQLSIGAQSPLHKDRRLFALEEHIKLALAALVADKQERAQQEQLYRQVLIEELGQLNRLVLQQVPRLVLQLK